MIKGIPYASISRSIARQMRGEVNGTYKTTQNGFYYYSCSGHGGFVVAKDALTDQQLETLERHSLDGAEHTAAVKMYTYKKIHADGREEEARKARYKTGYYYSKPTEEDGKYNVDFLSYEEDCSRALVVHLLGVYYYDRSEGLTEDRKERQEKYALKSMQQYYNDTLTREREYKMQTA